MGLITIVIKSRKDRFMEDYKIWDKLYNEAYKVQNRRIMSPFIEGGQVAAAILTKKGNIYTGICLDTASTLNIYTGICLDTASTLGICAERNAIFNMLTNGESQIDKIVCVMSNGDVGTPCGACRELIMQLDKDSKDIQILIDKDTYKTITMDKLMPNW